MTLYRSFVKLLQFKKEGGGVCALTRFPFFLVKLILSRILPKNGIIFALTKSDKKCV